MPTFDDFELTSRLDRYVQARIVALTRRDLEAWVAADDARTALMAHIDRRYVERDRLPLDDARAVYTVRTHFVSADDEIPVSPGPVGHNVYRTVNGVTARVATVGPDTPTWTDTAPPRSTDPERTLLSDDGSEVAMPPAEGASDGD